MLGLDRHIQQIDICLLKRDASLECDAPKKCRDMRSLLGAPPTHSSTDLRSCRSANVRGGSAFDDPLNMLREHRSFGVRQVTRRGQECD